MKEIIIRGVIGWEVETYQIKKSLDEVLPGEPVQIVIDSPGGDFFTMVPIYNLIRDFARNNPQQIETYIQGRACSAASMIALAAKAGNPNNKIIVEDISVFLIHNCWTLEIGDHRQMEKTAAQIRRIDDLQRDIYIARTGKTREEL